MPIMDLFWAIAIFFMWVIWVWLLITIFNDIFRDKELNGIAKAAWVIAVLFFPLFGVLIYLIVRGNSMHERQAHSAVDQQNAIKAYIQDASSASSAVSAADELEKLGELKNKGILTEEEFTAQKTKLLP